MVSAGALRREGSRSGFFFETSTTNRGFVTSTDVHRQKGTLSKSPCVLRPWTELPGWTAATLLAAIIERVTGKSYGQAMTDLFCGPSGMKNTGHDHQNELGSRCHQLMAEAP